MRAQLSALIAAIRVTVLATVPTLTKTITDQVTMLLTSAITALKADAIGKVASGVTGLFGDTALDKSRAATASQLEAAAKAGSRDAIRQLCFTAYEPRNGLPGDNRTPVDRKMSPAATRDLSVKALRRVAAALGGLPSEFQGYASKLGVDIIQPGSGGILGQVQDVFRQGVQQGVSQGVQQTAQDTAAKALPWALVGLVVIGGLVVYKLVK